MKQDVETLALAAALLPLGRVLSRAGRGSPGKAGFEFLVGLSERSGREEYRRVAPFQLLLDGWEAFADSVSDEKTLKLGRAIFEAMELLGECREEDPSTPLVSVFTLVDIGKGSPEMLYYRPVELDLGKEFPTPEREVEVTPAWYSDVVGRISYALSQPGQYPDSSRVMAVLERYLTFVPACTSDPRVSLYDYSRMLSALAVSLYLAGEAEKPFLFVEGDLSGIQRFVFTITSKGALKMLRARSIYLDLLAWDVVLEVLGRLGLPRSCIIYNGGGAFTLILPNTDDTISTLRRVRERLERFLLGEFDGSLYLALDWDEVGREEMRTFRNGSLWRDMKAKVGERKSRRFLDVIGEFVDSDGFHKLEECAVCRKQITPAEAKKFTIRNEEGEELKLCGRCYELWHLGTALPKTGLFVRIGGENLEEYGEDPKSSVLLSFSRIYWFDDVKMLSEWNVPPGSEVLLRNSLDLWKVPGEYRAYPYVVADYARLTLENGRKAVMEFKKLAENSLGAERIAVFKADVDNLGLIFSRGLKDRNPALVASLSRLMDYFFKAYLVSIISGRLEKGALPDDVPRLPTARELGKERHQGLSQTPANVVVVYAGGDDLFIVGAWNEVFNLAFLIRETFSAYTGRNPNVTMSAGIATFAHDFPVSRMAQVAEERLETAKDEGKDRVYIIERTSPRDYGWDLSFPVSYRWGGYRELWRRYAGKFRVTADGLQVWNGERGRWERVPKSQLWKLLELRELYVRNPDGIRWNYLLAYYVSRMELEGVFRDLVSIDLQLLSRGEPQRIYWIDGVLKPLLLAVRG
ncbi:CRISPR-associated protein, Csm1 family [Thermococcus cleftensis]|uniref:CRISPR system single-strand-specific deoxyribonuclease Cas10/Csm1 (subtype III-A) n=1 Tax=Thermococcus cleftensis (strain DSM 27260 / KACC 17922 / CL1) TaxID=163003 RepID=I3ZWR4_THECF|nr:type III-A CRISPR-associated protein Cas10/Csm1 [Thermococcus cleftensis]AFL96148.1 CRISPR-associated protein, Csm1 family [Thermococcus cleftensis]